MQVCRVSNCFNLAVVSHCFVARLPVAVDSIVRLCCIAEPCPSLVYQEHVKEYLDQDAEAATKLLDSLLNQLNWAFSEFVGMLQEVFHIAFHVYHIHVVIASC